MNARPALAALGLLTLTSCGGGGASSSSPPASASPSATAFSPGPASPSPTPTSAPREPRIVVADSGSATPADPAEVRLARLDAVDVGVMPGTFVGIVDDQVVTLNGLQLSAMDYAGVITKLGALSAPPSEFAMPVVLSPDLSQWLYTTTPSRDSLTAQIHEGSAAGDRIVATLASPDNNGVFGPYAWNATGVYLVLNATGIGGAGPFLEYHFPLYRFDLATGSATRVTPECDAYAVLSAGSLLCRAAGPNGSPAGLEIRASTGPAAAVPVKGEFADVRVSSDERRLVLAYRGGTVSNPAYQMGVARLASPSVTPFGPPGFVPEAWLPDGRVVATQSCLYDGGSTPPPCESTGAGGTRFVFSADGSSRTLFYKLSQSSAVGGVLS